MAVYLDFNASTPVDPRVLERMMDVYQTKFGNADSRTHVFGLGAKEIVVDARRTIAEILEIDSTDLLFTSGATESNNMAILGLLDYAHQTGKKHFVTTSIEHKSVLEAMKYLQQRGCTVDFVDPDESGRVPVQEILERVTADTLLVSVMHVNSETGIIQPVQELGEALANKDTYFHIDATQGFGKRNDDLRTTKYDMLSMAAHKLGGPQGVGALVLRRIDYRRPPIQPLMVGGPQERGYRPGTTPVALVAGFALAAKLCDAECTEHMQACHVIKQSFLKSISGMDYAVNGDQTHCIPSTINVSFAGVDAEGIFLSTKEDYAFSNGSACNAKSHAPSYVLTAMGLPPKRVSEAVRISWNHDTEVDFSTLARLISSMV